MGAGYSGTPLAKKLGVKEGSTVAVVAAPAGWSIPEMPRGVTVRSSLRGRFDLAVVFLHAARDLTRRLDSIVRATADDAGVWLVWPRKAGGHDSDITENLLREVVLPTGLVDVKVGALDGDWSGLKFVWRKELRRRH